MRDITHIDSVLGFDLSMELLVPEEDGNYRVFTGGIRSTVTPDNIENRVHIGKNIPCKSFFTNFNEGLLQKIRDYQRRNL